MQTRGTWWMAGRHHAHIITHHLALATLALLGFQPQASAQVPVNNDSRPAVSPAGDRVAFQSTRFGASDLYWMSVTSGWPRRLTRDAGNNQNIVWSPGGDRVAFESDRSGTWQLYSRALDDSAVTQLTDLPAGAHEPAYAPDGQRVVFTSPVDSVQQLFEVDLATREVRQLTRSPGSKREPSFSPLGDRLAFLSNATGGLEIVLARADGSHEERITSFAAKEKGRFVNGLGWTPEGRLFFGANRGVYGRYFFSTDLYTMNPDGTGLRRVLYGNATHNNPSVAADGSLIAFDSFRNGGLDIFVAAPDGSGARNLTASSENNFFAFPTPDGERVVFQSEREGQRDIYIMQRDGSEVRNLTQHPDDDRAPSISRDGRTIVFASFRASPWGDIYTMDLDGGHVTKVTPDGFFEQIDHFPITTSITPDGQTILFEAAPILVEGEGQWDIWRIERDGTGARRLTRSPGTARSSAPDVAPDGRSFIYFSNAGGDYDLYRMSIDGGPSTRLTNTPGVDYYATWSPGGEAIYFTSRRDGQSDIYRMSPTGSDVTRITRGTPGPTHQWGRLDAAGRNLWVHSNANGGSHIHRLNPDGTGEVSLTAPWGPTPEDTALSRACTGFKQLGQPSWSWARNEIAFPGDCNGGDRAIYVYSLESDQIRKLDLTVNAPDSPTWSYAGDRIAYNGTDANDDRDLYIYDLAAGRSARVTTGGAWGGWVTWSPDDQWLNGYGPSGYGTWDIFRVRTDGSERVRLNAVRDAGYFTPAESPRGGEYLYSTGNRLWRLTDESPAEPAVAGRFAGVMPRWAPDGMRYVFDGFEGFGWNLYIGDSRGGDPIPLTSADRATNGTWSPDGSRVVYLCPMGEITTLCIADVATRRSRPLFLPRN